MTRFWTADSETFWHSFWFCADAHEMEDFAGAGAGFVSTFGGDGGSGGACCAELL